MLDNENTSNPQEEDELQNLIDHVSAISELLKMFYDALSENDFSANQAMQLTCIYFKAILQKLGFC